jgi:peptidoglycan/LPS O-acetylase OafA/YrhL
MKPIVINELSNTMQSPQKPPACCPVLVRDRASMKTMYRPEIDGLRAISILLVVLFHSNMPVLSGGFVGVDVFFVISGYLITSIIQSELSRDAFSIVSFYERRIRRLFPALFVVLAFSTVAAFWLLEPFLLEVFGKDLSAASAFMSNLIFARNIGYFADNSHARPLLHLWSLSVEEQFYIVFPPVMIFLWAYARKSMVPALYAFAAISFAASVWMTFEDPSQAFYLPVYRAWELLIGAIIAVDGIPKLSGRIARIAPLVGLGTILLAGAAFSSSTPFPGLAALLPGLGAGLVASAGGENAPALLRSKPLVLLGLVSYPLYLWHWPVLVFARYALLRAPTPNETAALVLLSFALAWATWRAVEIPVRRWVDKRLQQRIVIFSVAAVALAFAGAAGAGAYLTHGFPSREPIAMAVLRPWDNHGVEQATNTIYRARSCFLLTDQSPAEYQDGTCYGENPDVLVWGDSFSAHLYPGLSEAAEGHQLAIAQASLGFCPPILGVEVRFRSGCGEFTNHVLENIHSRPPQDVILSAMWTLVPERVLASLPETIAQVQHLGPHVVVVGPSPTFEVAVSQIYFRLARGGSNPAFAKAVNDSRTASRLRQIALEAGATYIDPRDAMCEPESVCKIRDGDELLYVDAGHLSLRGSELVAAQIMRALRPRKDARAVVESR